MNVVKMRKSVVINNFLVQSSSAFVGVAYNFALSQVTDSTQLLTVFDQYRVNAIEIFLRPVAMPITATVQPIGVMYTVIDYDDSTPLTTAVYMLAYDNCIATSTVESQRRCFKPRVANALYGGSTFTSYGNERAPWIDSTSYTVPHYGLKAGVDQGNSTQLQTWSLVANVELEFRQAR
jgi:hypothetical protein